MTVYFSSLDEYRYHSGDRFHCCKNIEIQLVQVVCRPRLLQFCLNFSFFPFFLLPSSQTPMIFAAPIDSRTNSCAIFRFCLQILRRDLFHFFQSCKQWHQICSRAVRYLVRVEPVLVVLQALSIQRITFKTVDLFAKLPING